MKRVVGFFARPHGLNGLQALLSSGEFQLVAIATHRKLPKSEDPERSQRPEYETFVQLAKSHAIPLFTVDSQEEQQALEKALLELSFDHIACISWRRLIPAHILAHALQGGVNLHRGKLPDYAGAEPIKQALQQGEHSIIISAHRLAPEIDAGEVLCECTFLIDQAIQQLTLDLQIAQIKQAITPLFGPLLLKALRLLEGVCKPS